MSGKMLGLVGDAERVEIGLVGRSGARLDAADPAPGAARDRRSRGRRARCGRSRSTRDLGRGDGRADADRRLEHRDVLARHLRRLPARLAASKEKGGGGGAGVLRRLYRRRRGSSRCSLRLPKAPPYFTVAFSTSLKEQRARPKLGAALAAHGQRRDDHRVHARQFSLHSRRFDMTAKRETVGKLKAVRLNFTSQEGERARHRHGEARAREGRASIVYEAVAGTRLRRSPSVATRARASPRSPRARRAPPRAPRSRRPRRRRRGATASTTSTSAPVLGLLGTFGAEPDRRRPRRATAGRSR